MWKGSSLYIAAILSCNPSTQCIPKMRREGKKQTTNYNCYYALATQVNLTFLLYHQILLTTGEICQFIFHFYTESNHQVLLKKAAEIVTYHTGLLTHFCISLLSVILSHYLPNTIFQDTEKRYLMILLYSSSPMQVQLSKTNLKINFTLQVSHFSLGTSFF